MDYKVYHARNYHEQTEAVIVAGSREIANAWLDGAGLKVYTVDEIANIRFESGYTPNTLPVYVLFDKREEPVAEETVKWKKETKEEK